MPTSYNFTGQRLDSQMGLLYYNARYYDPVSGRFTSSDTIQNNASGMDSYAYVGDSPETRTDPTGKLCGTCGANAAVTTGPPAVLCGCGPEFYADPPPANPALPAVPPNADPYWQAVRTYIGQNGWQSGYSLIQSFLIQASNEGWLTGSYGGQSLSTNGNVQKYIAFYLAMLTYMYRQSLPANQQNSNANLAAGYFWVVGKDGTLLSNGPVGGAGQNRDQPAFGYDNKDGALGGVNATHSEAKLIGELRGTIIPGLKKNGGLPPGASLHVLIFSQNIACPSCENDYPAWGAQLQKAAGGAPVYLYPWEPNVNYTAPLNSFGLTPLF